MNILEVTQTNEESLENLKTKYSNRINNIEDWYEKTGIPKKVLYFYTQLGSEQRGVPESLMVVTQREIGGGVLNPLIENVGDLTNRMTPNHHLEYSLSAVTEKVENSLSILENSYPFKKEFEENCRNNAEYKNLSYEEYMDNIKSALKKYSNAHKELLPLCGTKIHQYACRAAMALGDMDFEAATVYLKLIKSMSSDMNTYIEALSQYTKRWDQYMKGEEIFNEDLRAWFGKGKEGGAGGGGWDAYNTKGERIGKCGETTGKAKPKCLSKSKAAKLRNQDADGDGKKDGKAGIARAVKRKRREDPNRNRKGAAKNVKN